MSWLHSGGVAGLVCHPGLRGAAAGVVAAAMCPAALAIDRFVDDSAPGGGTGLSWASPYNDLQTALAAAMAGDTIFIGQGTYRPAGPGGSRSATFSLKNGVTVRGGYAGFGAGDPTIQDPAATPTILSGDLNSNDVGFANNAENSLHVVTAGATITNSAVLREVTVRGGNADAGGFPDNRAGGLICNGAPTLTNVIFTTNIAASTGGAIYFDSSTGAVLTGCSFTGNLALSLAGALHCNGTGTSMISLCTFTTNAAQNGSGGAVAVSSGSPQFTSCFFRQNSAVFGNGGAVVTSTGGVPQFLQCFFLANSATGVAAGLARGGAIAVTNGGGRIINCYIASNSTSGGSTTGGGGGIHIAGIPAVVNCTITRNTVASPANGGGIRYGGAPASSNLANTIVWGNIAPAGAPGVSGVTMGAVTHNNIQGGFPGTGNIDADPLFADIDGYDNIAGTLDDNPYLRPASPCIDAGDNAAAFLPLVDLFGFTRRQDDPNVPDTGAGTAPIVDIGCVEKHTRNAPTMTWNAGVIFGAIDDPANWTPMLAPNYSDNLVFNGVGSLNLLSYPPDVGQMHESITVSNSPSVSLSIPAGFQHVMTGDVNVLATPGLEIASGRLLVAGQTVIGPSGVVSVDNGSQFEPTGPVEIHGGFFVGGNVRGQRSDFAILDDAGAGISLGSTGVFEARRLEVDPGVVNSTNGVARVFQRATFRTDQSLQTSGLVLHPFPPIFAGPGFVTPVLSLQDSEIPGVHGRISATFFTMNPGTRLEATLYAGLNEALNISGAASLGGALSITKDPAFNPPVGAVFRLLSSSSLTGAFHLTFLPGFPDNRTLRVVYDTTLRGSAGIDLVVDSSGALVDFDPGLTASLSGDRPSDAAAGNFNGDAFPDLVVALPTGMPTPGSVQVLLNNGVSGMGAWLGFSVHTQIAVGVDPAAVATGDFDNDGDDDFAVANRADDNVQIFLTNPTGGGPGMPTFSLLTTVLVGDQPVSLVAADLSGDAREEIVVANFGSDNVMVLADTPFRAIGVAQTVSVGDEPTSVDVGDMDNDKDLDLVTANNNADAATGTVSRILQGPGGVFGAAVNFPTGGMPLDLVLADADDDGSPDVVTADSANGTISILLNNGSGGLGAPLAAPVGDAPSDVEALDVDLDGDDDLAVVVEGQAGPVVRLIRNQSTTPGSVSFDAPEDVQTGEETVVLVASDVNNDGLPDIVVVNEEDPKVPATTGSVGALLNGTVQIDPADLNADGVVSAADLALLLGAWGPCPGPPAVCAADLNDDGVVGAPDLALLLGGWG